MHDATHSILTGLHDHLCGRLSRSDSLGEIKLELKPAEGRPGNIIKITTASAWSKVHWVVVDVTPDGHLCVSFYRYDKVSSYEYDNRTERLELDLANPDSIELITRSLRRYFSLCWGDHLKPQECSKGSADT